MGITSYWTDADGNVVFGPNTPKEKMKTTFTRAKTQKPKDLKMETVLVENMNKTEPEDEKEKLDITDSAAEESKDLDLQRSEDVKKED